MSNEDLIKRVEQVFPEENEKIVPLKDLTIKLTPEMLAKAAANIGFTTYRRDSVKGRIIDYLNERTEQGVQEYGHTLDDCPDGKYDWRLMVIEELIDCIQYQQKEIQRLERMLNP